ncbi:hypothetical protein Tco_0184827 [Tanacetum coccineum]
MLMQGLRLGFFNQGRKIGFDEYETLVVQWKTCPSSPLTFVHLGYLNHTICSDFTHLKAYDASAKRLSRNREQSTCMVVPLDYVAHTSYAHVRSSSSYLLVLNLTFSFNQPKPAQDFLLLKDSCYGVDGHIVTEPIHETHEKMDSQYFKDKALLMEAKEKGDVLDAEAEAFLADVECTAHYDQPQALTTTNMFQANHEDANMTSAW